MERDRPYDRTEQARRHPSEAKTRERFTALAQTGRFTSNFLDPKPAEIAFEQIRAEAGN